PLLVARAPGEVEVLGRPRDAGVEEVALLVRGLDAAQGGDAELPARLLAQQRVALAGARKAAPLQPAAEDEAGSARAQPVGARDSHAALGRAAPGRYRGRGDRLLGGGEVRLLTPGQGADLGQLGEQLAGEDAGAQLDRVERRALRARPRQRRP